MYSMCRGKGNFFFLKQELVINFIYSATYSSSQKFGHFLIHLKKKKKKKTWVVL